MQEDKHFGRKKKAGYTEALKREKDIYGVSYQTIFKRHHSVNFFSSLHKAKTHKTNTHKSNEMRISALFMTISAMSLQAFAATIPEREAGEALGGFQGTCQEFSFGGSTLYAWCKDRDGNLHSTSVDLNNCINNDQGFLFVSYKCDYILDLLTNRTISGGLKRYLLYKRIM